MVLERRYRGFFESSPENETARQSVTSGGPELPWLDEFLHWCASQEAAERVPQLHLVDVLLRPLKRRGPTNLE